MSATSDASTVVLSPTRTKPDTPPLWPLACCHCSCWLLLIKLVTAPLVATPPVPSRPTQWVWCGLNLGALGMFSLAFFEDATPFPYRLLLTGAAWVAGLLAALYGLRQFYRRRHALLTATDDPSAWESPRAPAIVVAVFAGMLALMVIYAVASHQTFEVHPSTTVGRGG